LLLPAAGFLSPLFVIPAITYRFGASGWASVAVAQSIGSGISTATEMGWGVVGPQRVAGLGKAYREEQYRLSITSRLITVVPGTLIAIIVAFALASSQDVAVAVLAGAMAAQAMTPSWYFIGIGKPTYIMWSESVPRIAIALASAIAIRFLNAPLVLYSGLMFLSVPFAQFVARRLIGSGARIKRRDWRSAPSAARGQIVMGSGRAVAVLYTSLPITMVRLVAPEAVAVFAATERLMRMCVKILGSVPLRMQSWIGSADGDLKEYRIRRAQQLGILMGITVGPLYAVTAPTISEYVFSGAVSIPYKISSLSGLLLFIICVSTSYGLTLVARGKANHITWAIIPSAGVAVAAIPALALWLGASGGILGEIVAESTGTAIQARSIQKCSESADSQQA